MAHAGFDLAVGQQVQYVLPGAQHLDPPRYLSWHHAGGLGQFLEGVALVQHLLEGLGLFQGVQVDADDILDELQLGRLRVGEVLADNSGDRLPAEEAGRPPAALPGDEDVPEVAGVCCPGWGVLESAVGARSIRGSGASSLKCFLAEGLSGLFRVRGDCSTPDPHYVVNHCVRH